MRFQQRAARKNRLSGYCCLLCKAGLITREPWERIVENDNWICGEYDCIEFEPDASRFIVGNFASQTRVQLILK